MKKHKKTVVATPPNPVQSNAQTFVRSHRTIGYEVARTISNAGKELVVLQTDTNRLEAFPVVTLLPVSEKELALEVDMCFLAAIFRSRFLGLDNDTLRATFERLLAVE